MVKPWGLFHQKRTEFFHQGAAQEISDRGVVAELYRSGRPVMFLDRLQIAEAAGEAESIAWSPKDAGFAGWGGCDLADNFGRCVLPEYDIVQGAFSWQGGRLSQRSLSGPLDWFGAGRECWACGFGAEKAVVDDGDRLRLIDQGGSQKGE